LIAVKNISGAELFDLNWKAGRLVVLGENDHLLRRFGQVDVIRLEPGIPLETHRTSGADEIWTLLESEATLQLTDLREESPTLEQKMKITLNGENPQAVLIPFGVAALISASAGAMLLRVSSHADDLFPDDQIFQRGESV
jgi:hypothetical protein